MIVLSKATKKTDRHKATVMMASLAPVGYSGSSDGLLSVAPSLTAEGLKTSCSFASRREDMSDGDMFLAFSMVIEFAVGEGKNEEDLLP